MGLEPTTICLEGKYSAIELPAHFKFGASCRNRIDLFNLEG